MNDVRLEAEERNCGSQRNKGGNPVEGAGEALWPQHVVAEEHGQVQDDADHGSRDGGQRGSELEVVMGRLDEWPASQDEDEGR